MFIRTIIRVVISRSVGLLRSSRWPFLAKEKVLSLQATTNYVLGIYSGWGHSEAKEISRLIELWVEVFQVVRIKNVDSGDSVNVGFAIEIGWKSRFRVHSALNFPTFANLVLSLCAEFQRSPSGKSFAGNCWCGGPVIAVVNSEWARSNETAMKYLFIGGARSSILVHGFSWTG